MKQICTHLKRSLEFFYVTDVVASELKSFIKDHPGFIVTLAYLQCMAAGLVYQWVFYGEFRINIVDFLDYSEILLSAFLSPLTQITYLLIVIYYVYLFLFSRNELVRKLSPIFVIVMIVFITFVSPISLAKKDANKIKFQHKTRLYPFVEYRIKGEKGAMSATLIGKKQASAFFYDFQKQKVYIIPEDNIETLTVEQNRLNQAHKPGDD